MNRHFLLRLLTALLVAGGSTRAARAQDETPKGDAPAERVQIELREGGQPEEIVVRLGGTTGFWLGLAFEDEGNLKVKRVYPDSPAEKAGFQPGDVVVASGDAKLKNLAELQQAVELSGGKSLDLTVSRDGKETVLQAKPVGRPAVQSFVIGEKSGEESAEKSGEKARSSRPLQFRALLTEPPRIQPAPSSKTPSKTPNPPPSIGWRILKAPNTAVQTPVPNDLEITIKKKGRQPTRIKVKQGGVTWTVSEDDVDKLPESIRGHVLQMLPGHRTPAATGIAKPGAALGFTLPTNPPDRNPTLKPGGPAGPPVATARPGAAFGFTVPVYPPGHSKRGDTSDSKRDGNPYGQPYGTPAGPGHTIARPQPEQPGVRFFPPPQATLTLPPALPQPKAPQSRDGREESLRKRILQLQQQIHELQEQTEALRDK